MQDLDSGVGGHITDKPGQHFRAARESDLITRSSSLPLHSFDLQSLLQERGVPVTTIEDGNILLENDKNLSPFELMVIHVHGFPFQSLYLHQGISYVDTMQTVVNYSRITCYIHGGHDPAYAHPSLGCLRARAEHAPRVQAE